MISAKKLMKIARKWQKMAAQSRRRISLPRNNEDIVDDHEKCTTTFVVKEGHFVAYTTDEKRFVMPLACLKHYIMQELFKMSEEEFGVSSDGPIRLPCDAVFTEYAVTLIRGGVARDLEKALVNSIETSRCSTSAASFHQGLEGRQIPVCGYWKEPRFDFVCDPL